MSTNSQQSHDPRMDAPCPCDSLKPHIPKPSQVAFRRTNNDSPEHTPPSRLLVMRRSPRFPLFGQHYTLIVWCVPLTDENTTTDLPLLTDLKPHASLEEREGAATAHIDDTPVLLKWRLAKENKSLTELCDILIEEYQRSPHDPLELYTPVVKFASAFCDMFSHIDGLSWVKKYQSKVINLDELCASFAASHVAERQKLQALGESWSEHDEREIRGHAALPEQWRDPYATLHIATDASYSRRTGGASAYVTSYGNYYGVPARGTSILCCELVAIEQAIKHARQHPGKVVIWSDSRLALSYISRLNSDHPYTVRHKITQVLDQIDAELLRRRENGNGPLVFRWIKAHTDCSSLQRILNDGADRLARHIMRNICRGQFTQTLASVCETIMADCMRNLSLINPSTECATTITETTFENYEEADDTDSCR